MKKNLMTSLLGLFLALGLTSAPQVFGQEGTRSLKLNRDSVVAGQALSKGNYTIKFDESKDGEVIFLKGDREVGKSTYRLTKLDKTPADTSVVYALGTDGSFQVKRIEFKGHDMALTIEQIESSK